MNIVIEKLSKQSIAFNRGKLVCSSDKLIDPRDFDNDRNLLLLSLVQEFNKFGYYLSSDLLCRLTSEEIVDIFESVIVPIQELHKDRKGFKPLYPGFPKQVIDLPEAKLWENSERVYSGDLEGFLKDNPWITKEDMKNIESEPSRLIGLMNEKEFMNIPNQIMSSGNSTTEITRNELLWFLDNYSDLPIPDKIPFKETLCMVVSKRPDYKLHEVNDVLRYGIYLMGGSPELLKVPKKKKLNSWSSKYEDNPEWRNLKGLPRLKRKEICKRIDEIVSEKGIDNSVKDAKKFYGHWILLSERVHPGEFFLKYPECSDFFRNLKTRELSKHHKTFNSVVQNMYNTGKPMLEIAKYVSSRPGEFLRRFDSFLRRKDNTDDDVSSLFDIFIDTEGMKNKTLLELSDYYDHRTSSMNRFVEIPGKGQYTLPSLEPLSEGLVELIQELIHRKILLNINSRVTEKDLSGKYVYIDPDIKKIPVPKGMRNKTFSIPTGARYKIPDDKDILRFFIHWIQEPGKQEDLDLHAYLFSKKNGSVNVGWNTALKYGKRLAVHSGDVLNRPGKCAEYIDVDVKGLRESGFTHIVTDIYNYEGRGLDSLPCWCGYSSSEKNLFNRSLEWYPENVDLMVPMKSKFSSSAAFIVDLNSMELIILDCDMNGFTASSDDYSLQEKMINFFSVIHKFSSFNVLEEYYKARGASVVTDIPKDEEGNDLIKVSECILFSDICNDYLKVLELIGE